MTDVAPRYAWRNAIFASTLTPTERLVALALEQFMSTRNGSAWPSQKVLGIATGLSTRTVRVALQRLVAAGYLKVATPASQHRTAVYRLLLRGEAISGLQSSQGGNLQPPDRQLTTGRAEAVSDEPLGTSREPLTSTRAGARGKKNARRGRASKSTELDWEGIEAYDR
jgi:hypothetical protein